MASSTSYREAFWLAVCAGILAWKLLLPGFVGMADNGDFGKVAGPLCLASPTPQAENFFHPLYARASNNCYQPHITTSEALLAGLASAVEQRFASRAWFDIRWLGAIHAAIFLAIYAAILAAVRPLGGVFRLALSLLALWIFADIGILAYFNSFYTDTAAILGVLAAAFLGVRLLAARSVSPAVLILFGAAALLATTSKMQHCLVGPIAAGLAFLIAWRAQDQRTRWTASVVGALLLTATVWIAARTPAWYRAQPRFDLVFFRIAKNSATPARDLAELGLDPAEVRYIGLTAFTSHGPMDSPEWAGRFVERCTAGRLLRFYLAHPARTWEMLDADLTDRAWQRRPPEYSNFARESGRPEGAMAASLGSWSALRAWASRKWPHLVVLWLILAPLAAAWFARREDPLQGALRWIMPAVSFLALSGFAIASLGDAVETPRHLMFFQVTSDLSLFLGLVFAASLLHAACPARFRRTAAILTAAGLVLFLAFLVRYEALAAGKPPAPQPDVPPDAVDDAASSVVYSGAWIKGSFGSAFHGTLTYSDQPGASARFAFAGTQLVYFYTKAPNRGLALVTIDGTPRATLDLYDPQIVWRAHTVFEGLGNGSHTVEIRVAGRHNSASSGNAVDVDAFAGK